MTARERKREGGREEPREEGRGGRRDEGLRQSLSFNIDTFAPAILINQVTVVH